MGIRRTCCRKDVLSSSFLESVKLILSFDSVLPMKEPHLDQRFDPPPPPPFGTAFEASGANLEFYLFESSSRDMFVG